MNDVLVYTDGSCYPNPGYGAWCAIIVQPTEQTFSGTAEQTTNNRMEMFGVIAVLESLPATPHNVLLRSDSMYVVNSINRWMVNWEKEGWTHKVSRGRRKDAKQPREPIKNPDLWQRLAALRKVHKLRAEWVRGHDGDKWNERCDAVANDLVAQYYTEKGIDFPAIRHLDAAFQHAITK